MVHHFKPKKACIDGPNIFQNAFCRFVISEQFGHA